MPRQTERQKIAQSLLQVYLALLTTEAQALVDPSPDSDSESDLSSESSDDEIKDIGSPSSAILQNILTLYACCYIAERPAIPKSSANLHLLLDNWKISHPDIFRSYVWVTLACFDLLTATLGVDPVFHNESNAPQMPVAEQLAIALFCFGHYGNAANIMKTALWAGVGYGTVHLATNRIIKAVCGEQFHRAALHWPNEAATEAAKLWVEDNSCPAWRNGWAMVDGTLVPLYARPAFFGNTWYDHKSNYSMNVQIVSTPDLQIIDYSFGLPGSQHDATAFLDTRIAQEHSALLKEGEFIWADTAYPLHTWCQAPYKKPEKETAENTTYNYHVSKICIQSEHCIGFLKGRWSSLRGLHLHIDNPSHIQFAVLWIIACIHLHAFAIGHEQGINISKDGFYQKGELIMRKEAERKRAWLEEQGSHAMEEEEERENRRNIELLEGRIEREELKKSLFEVLY